MTDYKTVVIATDLEHYFLVKIKKSDGKFSYEFPRAVNELGETSRKCARRQLREIASLNYDNMLDAQIDSDEIAYKVCLVDFYKQPMIFHSTENLVDYRLITKPDLINWIKSGKVTDKLTINGYEATKSIVDD